MTKVYVSLIADLLHTGHIGILQEAKKHGEVIVGLLTSSAASELEESVYLKYQQRLDVIENLSMVSKVIAQKTASYHENLINLKPDFVVHGDDWLVGPQAKIRDEVIELIAEWGGKLIEVPYNSEISDQNVKNQLMKLGITTVHRLNQLRYLIDSKKTVLIL
jgi:cytidyltransferase-like protein